MWLTLSDRAVVMDKNFKYAVEYALLHKYENNAEYRHCAIIVKGGSIVSVGYNQHKTNSFTERSKRNLRSFCRSTHAEINAVLKVRKKIDLTGTKIYVVRIRKDGSLANSRPCVLCQNVLYRYSIKKVYYSIDEEFFGKMKIEKNGITIEEVNLLNEEEGLEST